MAELRVPRPEPAEPLDEMSMARGWLTHLRESAIDKITGLDADQLRWHPADANPLGAVVVHLGFTERLWFRMVFAGEEMDMSWAEADFSHTFEIPDGWSHGEIVGFYRDESAAADRVVDAAGSFDEPSRAPFSPTTLRWIVMHMVEETARHVGHMDITRELLDGRTGR